MKKLLVYSFLLSAISASAQIDPSARTVAYNTASNPMYWKNRMPHPGYWQQDVHYKINAFLDYRSGVVSGSEELSYVNNSPDTLYEVYFHLYQNAFQPGSYLHNLSLANHENVRYGKYEAEKKGTVITSISSMKYQNESVTEQLVLKNNVQSSILDNTILRVKLNSPILPGKTEIFEISFNTYFDAGSNRRRMKKFPVAGAETHYDLVHWYPRICVYDRKFGWETAQHLGKEFYGDFGTFEVNFTIAGHYIVDGTGWLLNRDEVLPADLRAKLDIKNFAGNKNRLGYPAGMDSSTRKTWRFFAENVHDFALTMDPTYRIGEYTSSNGVQCIALAQEAHAHGWQDAAEFTAKVIDVYSKDFGNYAYPKMIVADAQDGMEYPMLTLDGGMSPEYHFVIAHEIGHNWFYGMVGSNETYRAALDEGFTQYLTAWSLNKIDGPKALARPAKSGWVRKFSAPTITTERTIYQAYLSDAMNADDPQLNTHSDDFNSALGHGGGYRQVYYKTAAMLANLQYVLGDTLFGKAMRNYFDQWKFAHPYFEDFRSSIIRYTKVDLNWFFDQWLETTKTLDYSVEKVKHRGRVTNSNEHVYEITLKRKGEMQSPLDILIKLKNGQSQRWYIPNTDFVKAQDSGGYIANAWKGWGSLNECFTFSVVTPAKIQEVIIDSSHRLADVNQMDNSSRKKLKWKFDSQVYHAPDRFAYVNYVRPDIWYTEVDGIKAGLNFNGGYYNRKHLYDATIWYNTGLLGKDPWTRGRNAIGVMADYKNHFKRNLSLSIGGRLNEGYQMLYGTLEKRVRDDVFSIGLKHMVRSMDLAGRLWYLGTIAGPLWPEERYNNTINLGYEHNYRYKKGNGKINLALRSPFFFSDYDYNSVSLKAVNHNNLGKLEIHTRAFGQFISGTLIAPESRLYLAGANPEEMAESKFTRSRNFFPEDWYGFGNNTNHLHAGGGLNLRGYAGYNAWTETEAGFPIALFSATNGVSASVEIDFDRFIPLRAGALSRFIHFDTYLFADAGVLQLKYKDLQATATSPLRADAGAGIAMTIKQWGALQKVHPFTFRFDMPLFLNTPPATEEYLEFRWVLGIGRSF